MEIRATTSKELYYLVWFFRSLAAKATKQLDEASEHHERTVRLIQGEQEDDLLLKWLYYTAQLLDGRRSEALRIELEHVTKSCPGYLVILRALCGLVRKIKPKAGKIFEKTVKSLEKESS